MHHLASAFVLGYHGCDRDVAESLLRGDPFQPSENAWDWLGSGIYFWEANPRRGLAFARERQLRNEIDNPSVVGAVLDLGFCLDLTTTLGTDAVAAAHADLLEYLRRTQASIPQNRGGPDQLRRELDCAVINQLHRVRLEPKPPLAAFDSVKAMFAEGERIYDGAGFFEKTPIQICVRNRDCIKGVFRVPDHHLKSL